MVGTDRPDEPTAGGRRGSANADETGAVESYLDKIAERIVQLGGIAAGTARLAVSRTRLPEYPLAIADGMAHVEGVACELSTFGKEARATIDEANALDDADTANLFTEISRGIDQ